MSLYYRGRDYEEQRNDNKRWADRQLLRVLWRLAAPVRPLLAGAMLLMLLGAVADLVRPYMMKLAIDHYVALRDIPGLQTLFTVYLSTILLSLILAYGENLLLQQGDRRSSWRCGKKCSGISSARPWKSWRRSRSDAW
jgi:ATP-binding cassette subfamily B protein